MPPPRIQGTWKSHCAKLAEALHRDFGFTFVVPRRYNGSKFLLVHPFSQKKTFVYPGKKGVHVLRRLRKEAILEGLVRREATAAAQDTELAELMRFEQQLNLEQEND